MKQILAAFSFALVLVSGNVLANPDLDKKAMQLAETGVVSSDANGDNQTTMVDVNGNLKVRPPVGKDGKPIDPNNPANQDSDGGNQSMPEQMQSDQ